MKSSVCDDNAFGPNCQTECHCKNASKCGENLACVCKDKWSGPRCQIKNVASNGEVNSSKILKWYMRGNLIDGIVDRNSLFHTEHVLRAWAVIDLQKPYVVSRVIVHDRPDAHVTDENAPLPEGDEWKNRSRELDIRVGNTSAIPGSSSRCFYIKKPLFGKSTNGTCMNGPIVGRYVSVQHNLTQPEFMCLAEVEVFGYPFTPNCSVKNTYGCLAKCNCLGNSTCDYLTGSCQKGCANSHIGKNCFSDFRVPGLPRLVNKTETSLSIEWNNYNGPRDDSGRGEIRNLKYRVKIRSSDGMKPSVELNAIGYTFKGLNHSTKYNISMSIVADIGDSTKEGPDGPEVPFVTVCQRKSVPFQPKVKEKNASTILLEWKDNGCQYEYLVSYRKESENTWTNVSISHNDSKMILPKPVPYTYYTIKVTSEGKKGRGRPSNKAVFTTEVGFPSEVVNFTKSVESNHPIRLEWSPPTRPNGRIEGYHLTCTWRETFSDSSNKKLQKVTKSTLERKMILPELEPSTYYECTIKANTSVGYGQEITRRFWTYPHKPQLFGKPKIRSEDTSDISVTLSLQEIEARVGNISEYQIVVQHVQGGQTGINASVNRKDVKCARESPHFYLAASFINKLPETFTVGDGSEHGPCPNRQLKKGETYVICIRAINEIDRNKEINAICTDKVTVKKHESYLLVIIVALGFTLIILVIIIVGVYRYIKRRSQQEGSGSHAANSTAHPGEIYLQPTPADHGDRIYSTQEDVYEDIDDHDDVDIVDVVHVADVPNATVPEEDVDIRNPTEDDYVNTNIRKATEDTYVVADVMNPTEDDYVNTNIRKATEDTYIVADVMNPTEDDYVNTNIRKATEDTYVVADVMNPTEDDYVNTNIRKATEDTYVVADVMNPTEDDYVNINITKANYKR
ncbi:uncharacterized protein LOC141898814 isoform X3 [Tubulanus polymorphus]|uniref:uncharacterized protein LOC141898814 isoform X3 n=1 Tax=Tubulanus polymorphus TaxID=672921 RepID=UPI003DA63623